MKKEQEFTNKNLELDLSIENDASNLHLKIINIYFNNEKKFTFSLSDENHCKLNLFIDFLLKELINFHSLKIKIIDIENLSDIDKDLCMGFKDIWESEFNKISEDYHKN